MDERIEKSLDSISVELRKIDLLLMDKELAGTLIEEDELLTEFTSFCTLEMINLRDELSCLKPFKFTIHYKAGD